MRFSLKKMPESAIILELSEVKIITCINFSCHFSDKVLNNPSERLDTLSYNINIIFATYLLTLSEQFHNPLED